MSKHISLPRSRMWRTRAATALAAAGALVMSGGLVMLAAPAATASATKVVVCKYVGTPGGVLHHVVIVSEDSLNNTEYQSPPDGDSWTDAHGQTDEGSIAIRYATAGERAIDVDLSECPGEPGEPGGGDEDKRVVVCKYVSIPESNEYLHHVIIVNVNSLKNDAPDWDGSTFPVEFADAHGGSKAIRFATAGEQANDVSLAECGVTSKTPAGITTEDPCGPNNVTWAAKEDAYFTYAESGGVVTATLKDPAKYVATGTTSWKLSDYEENVPCEEGRIDIPAPPTVSAPNCDSAGSFTVTTHDGMTTFLDGVKVTAPTVVSTAGKHTIGYIANPGKVFTTGKTRATQELTVLPATGPCITQTRSVPPAPVPTAPACEVDGSLILPAPADGLTWAIQQISGTTDGSSPYGPGVYRVTVTSSGLPFSTGGQTHTYPDVTVAPNTGPCVLGVQEIAPTVSFTDPTCENLDRAKWSGNLKDLVDYTVSGTPGRGNSITVTANIKPAVADEFAFPDGFDNTFGHSYPSKADLNCPTVKGSESSRPKPHKTPTVLGTQAVAPTAVDAGLASLPSSSATSTTSLLAQLMVAGGLLLLLAGGWLGLGRREDGAHQA
ncbi:MAG: hypothetical protein ACTHKG_10845 [Nocardioides sp.]